jgi:hypothetical protein
MKSVFLKNITPLYSVSLFRYAFNKVQFRGCLYKVDSFIYRSYFLSKDSHWNFNVLFFEQAEWLKTILHIKEEKYYSIPYQRIVLVPLRTAYNFWVKNLFRRIRNPVREHTDFGDKIFEALVQKDEVYNSDMALSFLKEEQLRLWDLLKITWFSGPQRFYK